jgi:CubicO group peptidase (beta-lactamase class C family)
MVDNSHGRTLASLGEFSWGGAGQTHFWVDPVEDVVVVFMTSVLVTANDFAVSQILHALVYGAMEESKAHPKQKQNA